MPPMTAMAILSPALSRLKTANALRGVKSMTDSSRRSFTRHFRLSQPCRDFARANSNGNNQSSKPIGRRSNSSNAEQFMPLTQEYEQQVSGGKLIFDEWQHRAAKKMTRLQMAMKEYDHSSFLEQLKQLEKYESNNQQHKTSDEEKNSPTTEQHVPPSISIPIPRGFYVHGSVGTGKSLLLNNFFNTAPTLTSSKKRRIHFHSFLQEIHQRIHDLNKQLLQKHGRSLHVNTSKQRNPILQVAEQLSQEVTLLCIDEFQVTDIADAMILGSLFGELWRQGVVIVATSNRPPRDLYEDGLNRGYFLPFVDMLEKYCVIHHLGNQNLESNNEEKDYRRIRSGVDDEGSDKCGDYFHVAREGNEEQSSQKLDRLFHSFREHSRPISGSQQLTLQVQFQRTISISRYHSNIIARFTFDELCTTELGSSDYHAIANHFQIVMIEDIPQLTLKHPDRARRFITLIDELYEAGCCFVCTAADIPDRLFVGKATDGGSNSTDDDTDINGNMHGIDVAQVQGNAVSELASVKELRFAFGRASSRLLEMCSNTWWKEQGAPSIVVEQ